MLDISKIKQGTIIQLDNEPYLVMKADHHKMARGGAVLKTRLRNLVNGNILDKTFQGNEKAEEAHTEKKKAQYLYSDEDNAYFMDNENYEQFSLGSEAMGEKEKFLKEGTDVTVLYFEGDPVAIELPVKMDFEVIHSPPGVKGNSANNTTKQVELETGITVSAPMFVGKGDVVRVKTDTGEYVERVQSK